MEEFISDWFIPMDFGNDMPDEEPNGEDNFNFDWIMLGGMWYNVRMAVTPYMVSLDAGSIPVTAS